MSVDHRKASNWPELIAQARALMDGEPNMIANAANLSALLYHNLADVNWVGFYFVEGDGLVVGPFQGLPACVRIPIGKGVCGTAAVKRETIVVTDVDAFVGHIPCDSASRSEIVVPLIRDGVVFGVLDVDSPLLRRFDNDADRQGLEAVADAFVSAGASAAAPG